MGCFTKGIVRFGVLAALAGGTAAVVAEAARPGSVGAIFHQATGAIGGLIDHNIDDPIALRAQIRTLEAQYPEKIAEVHADLAEVREQMAQLERDREVSEKVVQLTAADLDLLDTGLTRAHAAASANQGAIVRIAFNERKMSMNDALSRRSQVVQTKAVYEGRVSEIDTELTYLAEQEAQLADLAQRLETEHAEFQAQIFQLDAQIDSIARNDRLIEMMEDRQATIDEHSRYQAHSLKQLEDRLARVRGEQKARIASITRNEGARNYVDEARFLVDQEAAVRALIPGGVSGGVKAEPTVEVVPGVIEIDPSKPAPADQVVRND